MAGVSRLVRRTLPVIPNRAHCRLPPAPPCRTGRSAKAAVRAILPSWRLPIRDGTRRRTRMAAFSMAHPNLDSRLDDGSGATCDTRRSRGAGCIAPKAAVSKDETHEFRGCGAKRLAISAVRRSATNRISLLGAFPRTTMLLIGREPGGISV